MAYPERPSVVGDGGFAMLMAELTTAVANKLPVKIVILKNKSLADVKFKQKEIGNPEFGCDLVPIDFVAFAKACGAEGFRCERPREVLEAIQAALSFQQRVTSCVSTLCAAFPQAAFALIPATLS